MAIKIIKHGAKRLTGVCPMCGCEFEYGQEDLTLRYDTLKQLKCPDCGEWLTHAQVSSISPIYIEKPFITHDDTITWPSASWDTQTFAWPDCASCPNKPDPNSLAVFGDNACTFCRKMQPYCAATSADWKIDCAKGLNSFSSTITDAALDSATSLYAADASLTK